MAFKPRAERLRRLLDGFDDPDGRLELPRDRRGGLSREERADLAAGLLQDREVGDFLDDFPREEPAVRAEIQRAVARADRWLAYGFRGPGAPGRQEAIDGWREDFLEALRDKIRRYRQVEEDAGPFLRYLGSAWDLSSGALHPSVFDIWKYSAKLRREKAKIEAIARQLGRLQDAEERRREERLRARPAAPVWTFHRAAKGPPVAIRESDELAGILSSEAALLSTPETEQLFYLKFAEKKLLTYDYEARERTGAQPDPRGRGESGRLRKGPILVALDTSGSMAGEKEYQAKAFALFLIRIAFLQRRSVHLISFSGEIDTLTLTPPKADPREVLRFLTFSFHGGTDVAKALDEGLSKLAEREFRYADLIFLTDAQAAAFSKARVDAMDAARRRGNRFHVLVLESRRSASRGSAALLAQFDQGWRYDGSRITDVAGREEPRPARAPATVI